VTVYVLTATRNPDERVLGVYSSREKAIQAVREFDASAEEPRTDSLGTVSIRTPDWDYQIEPYEIDGPWDRYDIWGVTGTDPEA
jgi:hypothetical protein